jgi:hypothetical protein
MRQFNLEEEIAIFNINKKNKVIIVNTESKKTYDYLEIIYKKQKQAIYINEKIVFYITGFACIKDNMSEALELIINYIDDININT